MEAPRFTFQHIEQDVFEVEPPLPARPHGSPDQPGIYFEGARQPSLLGLGSNTYERAILEIDRALYRQLDQILHHPRFQKLEASWRGLLYLVETEAEYDEDLLIKIKLLNISWPELAKDVTRALEFDQSHVFRRIYSDEFDMPGGEPFGVILGDYEISHRPRVNVSVSDIDVLREIGQIATAALCPFVASASASLFGVDSLAELPRPTSLQDIFQQREYVGWHSLRRSEFSRFIGLALPRVLMRKPYRDDGTRHENFSYRENVTESREHYLWGSPCYAFGGVLIRAFANTNWFADIRGGVHDFGEGGVVRHMQHSAFAFDRRDIASRTATELQVDDFAEREFSDFGFISLCSHHSADHTVFYSNSSLHQPGKHNSDIADANEKLAAMLQYMLCVSRFGHYIKVIGRDKIGSFVRAEECQRVLQNWLNQYTTSNEGGSAELKAHYPLAASRVEVKEAPGRPGHFTCIVHLQPHFQLDQLVSSIRLVTELAVGAAAVSTVS